MIKFGALITSLLSMFGLVQAAPKVERILKANNVQVSEKSFVEARAASQDYKVSET